MKWSEAKVPQSCPTLCDPVDYTVHGILQARILEWVVFPFSRGSSQPRDGTQVSHNCRRILYQLSHQGSPFNAYQTPNIHRHDGTEKPTVKRERTNQKKTCCPQGGFVYLINKQMSKENEGSTLKKTTPPDRESTALSERPPPADIRGWAGEAGWGSKHRRWGREQGGQLERQEYPLQPKPTGGKATQNTAVREEEISLQTCALPLQGKTQSAFLFPSFSRILYAMNLTKLSF